MTGSEFGSHGKPMLPVALLRGKRQPTKTQMVDRAGGAPPRGLDHNRVLASVVFLIGVVLVDLAGVRKVSRLRVD